MQEIKAVIAGGRDFVPTERHRQWLKFILKSLKITEVVSGTCRGADLFGEEIAKELNIPVKQFPADWNKGQDAGFKRNVEMAVYADIVILFKGGNGTAHMEKLAKRRKMKIIKYLVD